MYIPAKNTADEFSVGPILLIAPLVYTVKFCIHAFALAIGCIQES